MKNIGIWLVLAVWAALFLACGGSTTTHKDLGTDTTDTGDVKIDSGKDLPGNDVSPDKPGIDTFDVPPDEQPVDVPPEEDVAVPDEEDVFVDVPTELPADIGPEVAPHPFWCRLQTPLTLQIVAGNEGTVFGRVRLDGVTDKTDKTDPDPDLLGQVGYGPDGSDPSVGEAWVWVDASPSAGWNAVTGGEPGVDEYKGFLTAPAAGTYDYAYRFSKDGGESWLYCDGPAGPGSDGSEDGYQPANAGSMTVSPKPGSCVPNPCTKPPASKCDADGVTRIFYASPGTCTVVEGKAVCDYPPQTYDCSLDAKVCKNGACGKVDDPCDPNPCTDAPPRECDPDGEILTYYSELGDCSVEDGQAECDYLSNFIDCTLDGLVCMDGACVPPKGEIPRDPGDVIITEFMAKSTTGTDYGEWVEVYNAADYLIDLDGCVLKDDGSNLHTLKGPLTMKPGTYKVLARSGDPAQNYGLPADYIYSNFTLANEKDQIVITCKGVEIDRVTYTSKLVTVGASTQLSSKAYDSADNDLPENWCFGKKEYGTDGKLGTPGADNHDCKTTVDWCRFQGPMSASILEGGSVDFFGRVFVEGVTDLTPQVDADPLLKGQVGFGLEGSNPDGNALWTWVDAAGNGEWNGILVGEPENDEYVATVTVSQIGTWNVAFRFSYDGGKTWTYCDGAAGEGSDGSEDGYLAVNAGVLVVTSSADPCSPNPCVAPHPPTCDADGKILTTYETPGTCTVEAGTAKCAYASQTLDCTKDGKVCSGGACVVPVDPCNPNPCTKPPAAVCDSDGKVATTWASPGTCTIDGGSAKCDYVPTPQDCVADGKICKDGACVAPPTDKPTAAGDVIVTEFMARSVSGTDNGEWVEIYNNTQKTLDLDGCILKDDNTDAHTIVGPLTFGPGKYLVLARSKDPVANHGLPFDYVYSKFALANDGDAIVLACGDVEIDRVVYKSAQVILGTAWQLGPSAYDAVKNDDMANWCPATQTYGTAGKFGTPGQGNDSCSSKVDWCRLQWPLTATVKEGEAVDYYGRVFVAGVTDKTAKVDADVRLKGQAGFGPDNSNPDLDPNWIWVDAIGNDKWDANAAGEPKNDEYMTKLTPLKAGTYDTAFRFSFDGGKTWTYCDTQAGPGKDGSEDGYDPANAGTLAVSATSDPCTPNPCTTPDNASCTGNVLTEYETPGTCTVVEGAAKCAYTKKETDCAADGKVCQDGTCVNPADPCTPNPCTTPPAAACDLAGKILTSYEVPGTCTNDNGAAKCEYPPITTDCTADGKVCVDGACVTGSIPQPQSAGDVIVTEFMARAVSGTDDAEWVEVFNTTQKKLDLGGCVLKDDNTNTHTIVGPLVIDPGKYLVLAKSSDAAANFGLPFDYKYANFSLNNDGDQIVLLCGDAEIDRVVYGPDQVILATALQLSNMAYTATANDDMSNWCPATAKYGNNGTQDLLGTPGADNAECKNIVGWCRFQHPLSVAITEGDSLDVYGRLHVAGVTDKTKAVDADPRLRAQAGYGPDGTDPATDATWKWTNAAANTAWDDTVGGEPGNDEYQAKLTLVPVGTHDMAFRFSMDWGRTWTYCDGPAGPGADGSENGYQAVNAGALVVNAKTDPCTPNPCTTPPAASCDAEGKVLTTYDSPGTCTNVGGQAACDYAPNTTDCTATGKVCKDAECVVVSGWAAGDLVITEFMARAVSGTDNGEWVEVYNATSRTLDLDGCVLRDDNTNTHTLVGPLTIAPGKYLVLAKSSDTEANFGLPFDYKYSNFSLNNDGDQIVIQCGGIEIDRVVYGVDQVVLGTALQLSSKSVSATANDDMAAWCPAFATYGTGGKLGTPGAANAECHNVVDWCRLQHPLSLSLTAGKTGDVYGRVYVAGVTSKSDAVDADPRLRAEVGWGPDGSNPDGHAGWTWLKASANTGWNASTAGEPNNDEYVATLTAMAEGQYDFAYRFSMDWGKTWKYCDGPAGMGKDGSEDGYSAANAGDLVVTASSPCDPNPCTTAPAATCDADGKVLTTYTAPGTCEVVDSAAKCTYPSTPTDCTLSGKVCKDGACVEAGAETPSVAGQIVITEFMPRSISGTDNGEWVEVYNASAKTLDLKGCVLKDDKTVGHTIASSVVIAPKVYVVLAMSSDPAKNWGLPKVDYVYGTSTFSLANSGTDQIVLKCGDLEIDRVAYGTAQVVLATARQLSGDKLSAALNDDAAVNWCAATAKYGNNGTNDVLGTPGSANGICQ